MSKNLFVGVDGKARKAKEFYVGVNGKARRIVKAYIGDENGKARPFWEKESHLGENSLEFVSDDNFSMSATKLWNGTIEYNNGNGWITWNGSQILSREINGRQRIYLRGSRNSYIRGQNATRENPWKILWSNVECNGNIECLLDYQKVAAGEHPEMGIGCYKFLFYKCSNLITAPQLLATTLVEDCYYYMFSETSITTAPQLPATTLARGCYLAMFEKCSSLTTAPELPVTTLAQSCYYSMFSGCSSLTTAPELPATTLVDYCYSFMFEDCSSITTAPELPATTLAQHCYSFMFLGTSITTAPELPVTTLAKNCYHSMFANCASLTTPPELPATTLAEGCYYYMFNGCSSLTTAPALHATTLAKTCYYGMFANCVNLTRIPALNATTLIDYCYFMMFKNCPKVKPATQQSENYSVSYRVPIFATATSQPSYSMTDMFSSETESNVEYHINTTYWLPKTASVIIS